MQRIASQRLAGLLTGLCVIVLLCGLPLLPLAPVLAYFHFQDPASIRFDQLMATFAYDRDDGLGNLLRIILWEAWQSPDRAVLALFLLLTGVCGGGILVQGIRILSSVADGTPFLPQNTVYLRRAAHLCFLITAGAAGRTLFILCREGSSALLSYTALFIPVSIMFGLLFLVMSALFRQAAEMKAENDLTI